MVGTALIREAVTRGRLSKNLKKNIFHLYLNKMSTDKKEKLIETFLIGLVYECMLFGQLHSIYGSSGYFDNFILILGTFISFNNFFLLLIKKVNLFNSYFFLLSHILTVFLS